jgi:hypothetical protein
MTKLTGMSPNPRILEDQYTKTQLAKALAGALLILKNMECPNCGEPLEANLEGKTKADREPGGRGANEVVSE